MDLPTERPVPRSGRVSRRAPDRRGVRGSVVLHARAAARESGPPASPRTCGSPPSTASSRSATSGSARRSAGRRPPPRRSTCSPRHAFDELGYRRLEWKCDSLNQASRRAAERFGFRFEGVFRSHMVVKGRNRDTAWFAITDGEWPAVRAGFSAWLEPGQPGRRRAAEAEPRRADRRRSGLSVQVVASPSSATPSAPSCGRTPTAISREVWPEYNQHGAVLGRYWGRLFEELRGVSVRAVRRAGPGGHRRGAHGAVRLGRDDRRPGGRDRRDDRGGVRGARGAAARRRRCARSRRRSGRGSRAAASPTGCSTRCPTSAGTPASGT